MIYIETDSNNVYFNFATEHYFLHEKILGENLFLFWRTTPTLMVGKHQNITSEINLKYANEHNITIARRPSGGGTIYTDDGSWQYSYIMPHIRYEEINFKENSSAVIGALNRLSVPASFNELNDILIRSKKYQVPLAAFQKTGSFIMDLCFMIPISTKWYVLTPWIMKK